MVTNLQAASQKNNSLHDRRENKTEHRWAWEICLNVNLLNIRCVALHEPSGSGFYLLMLIH